MGLALRLRSCELIRVGAVDVRLLWVDLVARKVGLSVGGRAVALAEGESCRVGSGTLKAVEVAGGRRVVLISVPREVQIARVPIMEEQRHDAVGTRGRQRVPPRPPRAG